MGMQSTTVKTPSAAAEEGASKAPGRIRAARRKKFRAQSPAHISPAANQPRLNRPASRRPSSQIPVTSRPPAASTAAPGTSHSSLSLPPLPLQRKLAIGATNDPLEHEADRVADRVMRMPDPAAIQPPTSAAINSIQRKCSCGGTCESCKEASKKKLQRVSTHPVPEFMKRLPS